MKLLATLVSVILIGCATTTPPVPKIEYTGASLRFSKEYSIQQLSVGSSVFTIAAPSGEKILVNLYEPDGKLGITLYDGPGAVLAMSLALKFEKYDYTLKSGKNKLVLFGESGMAEYSLIIR